MNDNTLLYRQIHPSFVQEGRVSSAAFRPTPKDQMQLSVYDGDKLTPESAYRHYHDELHLKSIGVLAVSVSDCNNESLEVIADYCTHPYHVLIDFTGKESNQTKRIAEHLKAKALLSGWLYVAKNGTILQEGR